MKTPTIGALMCGALLVLSSTTNGFAQANTQSAPSPAGSSPSGQAPKAQAAPQAAPKAAPKADTGKTTAKSKSWEPICPPDCGGAK